MAPGAQARGPLPLCSVDPVPNPQGGRRGGARMLVCSSCFSCVFTRSFTCSCARWGVAWSAPAVGPGTGFWSLAPRPLPVKPGAAVPPWSVSPSLLPAALGPAVATMPPCVPVIPRTGPGREGVTGTPPAPQPAPRTAAVRARVVACACGCVRVWLRVRVGACGCVRACVFLPTDRRSVAPLLGGSGSSGLWEHRADQESGTAWLHQPAALLWTEGTVRPPRGPGGREGSVHPGLEQHLYTAGVDWTRSGRGMDLQQAWTGHTVGVQ